MGPRFVCKRVKRFTLLQPLPHCWNEHAYFHSRPDHFLCNPPPSRPHARQALVKIVLTTVGILAIVLGVIGIFVPLLPTTPFLLLAAACFARSNKDMQNWLLNHRLFGSYLRNYEEGRGIPFRAKVLALVLMWSSLAYAAWRYESLWLRLLIVSTGAAVSMFLLRLPTSSGPPSD